MSASIKTTKLERRKINNEVWNATIQFLLWVIGAESRGRGGAGREERQRHEVVRPDLVLSTHAGSRTDRPLFIVQSSFVIESHSAHTLHK